MSSSPTEKICSRCGALFSCGAAQSDQSCWCEQLPRVPLIADEQTDCFCPKCLSEAIEKINVPRQTAALPLLREGEDYYLEGGAMVFTAAYHLKRGYCCDSGCRHCPYDQKAAAGISARLDAGQ